MMILNLNVSLSAVMCIAAAAYGFYILYKHLHITKRNIKSNCLDALPIILGTLSWSTASLTFLEMPSSYSSPIEIQRVMMVVAWCWLVSRYRHYKTK